MPTNFTDQFFFINPFAPPPAGTALNFSNLVLTDQNDDNDVDANDGDSVNGQDVTNSYPGDTVVVNIPGTGDVTYTGITFYLADGSRVFTPTDGQVLQNGTFVSSTWVSPQGPLNTGTDLGPPCFTPGTRITTPAGGVAIEELRIGDLVSVANGQARPIRWISNRTLPGMGAYAPIKIAAGTLGNTRDLSVSPQHRMLMNGWRAELFFGASEVLVHAKHLVNDTTIRPAPCEQVTYIHLLLDQHDIIFAEGAATESLDPQSELIVRDRDFQASISSVCPRIEPASAPFPTVKSADAAVMLA